MSSVAPAQPATVAKLTARDVRVVQLLAAGVFAPVKAPMDAIAEASVRDHGVLLDGTAWHWPLVVRTTLDSDATSCRLEDAEGRSLGNAALARDPCGDASHRLIGQPAPLPHDRDLAAELAASRALSGASDARAYVVEDALQRDDVDWLTRALPVDTPLLLLRLTGCSDEPCHLLHATREAHALACARLPHRRVATLDLPRPPTDSDANGSFARIASNLGAALIEPPPSLRGHRAVVHALLRGDEQQLAEVSWPDVVARLRAAYLPAGHRGVTVLLTGLSGAGKSTIARRLADTLMSRSHRPVSLLDGDLVRQHLSRGLGFDRAGREANVLRIAFVAREVTRHGGIAVCAPIAPYEATRARVREWISEIGEFVEIHVATPLAVCEARDPKGLYARARAGALPGFTGIDDPYEPPRKPELRIDTSALPLDGAVALICQHLTERGLLEEASA